jgi:hypothetical protein
MESMVRLHGDRTDVLPKWKPRTVPRAVGGIDVAYCRYANRLP